MEDLRALLQRVSLGESDEIDAALIGRSKEWH